MSGSPLCQISPETCLPKAVFSAILSKQLCPVPFEAPHLTRKERSAALSKIGLFMLCCIGRCPASSLHVACALCAVPGLMLFLIYCCPYLFCSMVRLLLGRRQITRSCSLSRRRVHHELTSSMLHKCLSRTVLFIMSVRITLAYLCATCCRLLASVTTRTYFQPQESLCSLVLNAHLTISA